MGEISHGIFQVSRIELMTKRLSHSRTIHVKRCEIALPRLSRAANALIGEQQRICLWCKKTTSPEWLRNTYPICVEPLCLTDAVKI